jgi:hypothetical protein
MPRPVAASSVEASTPRNPVSVLMTSGGPARSVRAIRAGFQPSPKNGSNSRMTARLGMTRTAATAPTMVDVNLPPNEARIPSGMKISMAIDSAPKLSPRCTSSAC